MRSRQAQLYRLLGDEEASAAATAEAQANWRESAAITLACRQPPAPVAGDSGGSWWEP
ncbi:hypothetical protein GCM10010211_60150 [Streptomyces albospinus]|uniref:Uncharacterized protein n=1 Tax=Streptomyces albospinus TaxID=285515 RepID=A0ABQ2VGL9_9ACTN|nr:hypothetical protein GCM10010211_60150 [Streptomyces albospinus]